jgi:DNA-binding NtrC family response regulator
MKTLLLIDDDKILTTAVGDICDLLSVPFLTAHTPTDGLALFQAHQADIGLVVLDVRMRDNGKTLLEQLQAMGTPVPIIVSSGGSEGEGIAAAHGVAWQKKPYDIETVDSWVMGYLGQ